MIRPRQRALAACLVILAVSLPFAGRWSGLLPAAGSDPAPPRDSVSGVEAAAADVADAAVKPEDASLTAFANDARRGLRVEETSRGFKPLLGWPSLEEAELRFEEETVDAEWSRVTEGRLLSMISSLDRIALQRLEATCRESMCRLELFYPPDIEPVYSIRQIYERVGDLDVGPVLAETAILGGGVVSARIFLRREAR